MEEKRKYSRFTTAIRVQDLDTLHSGWTKNISMGGCLLEKAGGFEFLPLATRLKLKLAIPGISELVVIGGTVRHRGKYGEGFGIQFEKVDKKSAYYIGKFMGTFL